MNRRTGERLLSVASAVLAAVASIGCSSSSQGTASGSGGAGGAGTGGGGAVPLSCQASGPGLTDCGPNHESCCTSLAVPGGTYDRTYTPGSSTASDAATISAFRLDKYLVTVGRFRRFVAAWNDGAGYTPAAGAGKHAHLNGGKGLADSGTPGSYEPGWVAADDSNVDLTNDSLICSLPYAAWTNAPGTQETLPMNCVTWWEAYAFCIWDGGFLPSDAESEYAAAGGDQQRPYPWGTAAPGSANQYAIYGCNYPNAGACSGVANIAPVGTAAAGAGRWGQLDLVGDLSAWTLDWYQTTYDSTCTDCADLTEASGRVTRGAYFSSDATLLSPTYRTGLYGTSRGQNLGFRCARVP